MGLANWTHSVGEQVSDLTRSLWPWSWAGVTSLRTWDSYPVGLRFWQTAHPTGEGSLVNYDSLRSLYRNDSDMRLGTGFAKPIVDLQVAFIGIPNVTTDNEALSEYLNACVHDFWVDEIQQVLRDSIRDSKTVIRITKPDVMDPLMTLEESRHCKIESIPPERVDIERRPSNKDVIERALIRHRMVFIIDEGSAEQGVDPTVEEHDVIEIIDRERFKFWDQTTSEWLDSLGRENSWGFVPLIECHNEFDASLQGGTSDLETVIPFMQAFHDVLTQGLQAHKYHSTPKIKMKLSDVAAFIRANFPDIWDDATGNIKPGAEISWQGREIVFLQTGDDMEFVEARSVLGDTKTLAEFLIDCICIASQTPEWAFMRVDSGSANSDRNAQTVPFVKKVERKRNSYTPYIQVLLKMAQLISGLDAPVRPTISWEIIRPDDQILVTQAFQQLVMGLEVAAERGEISDETYRRMINQFLPVMKTSTQEEKDAEKSMEKRVQRAKVAQQAVQPDPSQNGHVPGGTPVIAGPQGKNE